MSRLLSTLILLGYLPSVYAAGKLEVAPYVALYRPALEDLNEHEFKSPIAGVASVIVDAGDAVPQNFVFENPLPQLGVGAEAGLEFLWPLNDNYDFIFGGGTWESSSSASASGSLFLQGEPADFKNERKGKISFNEFYFGLKYKMPTASKKYRAYYRLTLNEVFDIDYREDLIFLFTSGDANGVKKSIILESQATGLLMLQPGFGMDYSVTDWLSISAEAAYVIGFRRVTLVDGKSTVDFLPTDNLSLILPQRINPASGDLQYLSRNPVDDDDYTTMKLSFDGWKLLLRMSISF